MMTFENNNKKVSITMRDNQSIPRKLDKEKANDVTNDIKSKIANLNCRV